MRTYAILAFRSLVIMFPLALLQGCNLTTETPPTGSVPNPRWKAESGGAVNYSVYVTNAEQPAGTEIRLRIEAEGEPADVRLICWHTRRALASWKPSEVTNGQVLSLKLSEPCYVGVEVGGVNYYRKSLNIAEAGDSDRMTFERGWIILAKLLAKEF